jgi:hypothetical protein
MLTATAKHNNAGHRGVVRPSPFAAASTKRGGSGWSQVKW